MTRVPKLCRNGPYCYVTDPAAGRQVPMGRADDPETPARYEAWRRDFLARAAAGAGRVAPGANPSLAEVVLAHDRWAEGYYRKGGRPTSELGSFRQLHRFLDAYFHRPARDFKPTQLKSVRDAMVAGGLARSHVNEQVARVRRVFRWAVAAELVAPDVLAALAAVTPLARGRTAAPEGEPVRPVTPAQIEATLPRLKPRDRAMVLAHLHTGCRAQEIVRMRPCEIDRSREPWEWRPAGHKGEHKGLARVVLVGPKARAVLLPLLDATPPGGWVFRAVGVGRMRSRTLGHITVGGYRQAVAKACKAMPAAGACRGRAARPARAAVEHWSPLQVRHAAGTLVRAAAGLEAAQVILGHSKADVTQVYAERNFELGRKVAEEVG